MQIDSFNSTLKTLPKSGSVKYQIIIMVNIIPNKLRRNDDTKLQKVQLAIIEDENMENI